MASPSRARADACGSGGTVRQNLVVDKDHFALRFEDVTFNTGASPRRKDTATAHVADRVLVPMLRPSALDVVPPALRDVWKATSTPSVTIVGRFRQRKYLRSRNRSRVIWFKTHLRSA